MTNTEKYIGTVKYFENLFDYINEHLFNNELIKPVITVQVDVRNKSNGWFTCKKVWKENPDDEGNYELNMSAQALNRPLCVTDKDCLCSTLIHEMCHLYAEKNNLQDCSRSGTYHNKLFKRIAETHGLNVECVKTIGWSYTTLKDETANLIADFVKDNPEAIIYRTPITKGQRISTSSTRKYICPCCGNSVRATKEVNIMCADCDKYMQEE